MSDVLSFSAVDGIGEVHDGDDLAELICASVTIREGDVIVVTSKIVSKSLGLATTIDKAELLAEQTDRIVARRGETRIVRTHHGLTMAAAGIDASNTAAGTLLPLPADPDVQARRIRARIGELTGTLPGVIISDTAGRAWRVGQTDIAIGCAGVVPVESFAGRDDDNGRPLIVTAPAVADEITGAAELASGKLGRRPVVVVRGVPSHLLTGEDGPGASALVRDEDGDLFGLGSREAVEVALAQAGRGVRGFPSSDLSLTELIELARPPVGLSARVDAERSVIRVAGPSAQAVEAGMFAQRLLSLATAHGLPTHVHVDLAPPVGGESRT